MSGAEAGFVIGLVASVITIFDTTKKVYDAAKDAKGQPEAFRQVAARLPLVIEILRSAEARASTLDETALEALEDILEACKAKAEDLRKIFQKVIRKDDDKWYDRYKKAMGTLRKGSTVECLMEAILKDIQVLACEKLTGTATDFQVKELEESIKEMHETPSSLRDEAAGVNQTHSGSGDNIGHTGPGTMNIHKGKGDQYHNVISGNANFGSNLINPTFNISNHPSQQHHSDLQDRSCLQDLRTTDPREDKKRIEDTKGGLLRDSYQWVFEHPDFHKWRNAEQGQVLWIKGDPGKGKTMLLCGIIDEMSSLTSLGEDKNPTTLLSYFFCQATDTRINNAVAVLRGLIYMLIDQQPWLIKHVQKKYDHAGKALFEDVNAWVALSEIFAVILQDPGFNCTYLIIDALDECVEDLAKLLDFIVQRSPISRRVKWIVSSRNWPDIEERLGRAGHKVKLCLELNAESISTAVRKYIGHKVHQLAQLKKYDEKTRVAVLQYLASNADDTFLWVALVCQNLEKIPRWNTRAKLTTFPPGLDSFYQQMIKQIYNSDNADLYKRILALTAIVYRPLRLKELTSLVEILEDMSDDLESLREIIGFCGSFLTIREGTIYFVHQSAKDYLLTNVYDEIFPSGRKECQYVIFSRSLQVMSRTLRRDVYNLRAPGVTIDQVKQPDPDPLAIARYSCVYWLDHLLDFDTGGNSSHECEAYRSVYSFLCQSYLYWLEALSLIKSLPRGILMIRKLENWLQAGQNPDLFAFVHDSKRFALYNRSLIEQAPLQTYCSALLFSPEKSIIRVTFDKCIPSWIQRKPRVQAHWSAALQVLEGHSDSVNSVAFSPDGKQVISGSIDNTVRLWDTTTGGPLQTLKGHSYSVNSVAFSPDGKQVVSGSYDKTVRLWDATTGVPLQTLKGHSDSVRSVTFSPDGKQVVSGSNDNTVRLWDTITGVPLQTLEGHSDSASSVAFSPDGKQVISGSIDNTVRLWDATTGVPLQTLEGHSYSVYSIAFSPDGKQVVSGSDNKTVRLWDATTGVLLQMLKGHSDLVCSVAFSPDSKQVVSGSDDNTVRLWDATIGRPLQMLKGHSHSVKSVAFSPDSKQVVSGSYDETVRLWDATTGVLLQMLKGHSHSVSSVAFSPDGKQVVSGSYDKTVRLWDAITGRPLQTLKGHSYSVKSVAFSPDSKQVVSGSYDETVRLWDATTGVLLQTLKGHSHSVSSVAFSPNGKQVISGSYDKTVRLWDATTGVLLQTLKGHSLWVNSVAFSPDGQQVVSGSDDKTVRLWDAIIGVPLQTLKGHSDSVRSVTFSPDSKQVVSGSYDETMRRWDATTGVPLQTLEGHSRSVTSIAFSPDGKLLPTLRIRAYWLVDGITNVLWLPPDYRPTCEAIWGEIVILGHSSGRISFLQIKKGPKFII